MFEKILFTFDLIYISLFNVHIIPLGKGILFDYLAQGTKERLTAPMIKCVMALGRRALVECLADHLDHLDDCIHAPRRNHLQTDLRETILVSRTSLLLVFKNVLLDYQSSTLHRKLKIKKHLKKKKCYLYA